MCLEFTLTTTHSGNVGGKGEWGSGGSRHDGQSWRKSRGERSRRVGQGTLYPYYYFFDKKARLRSIHTIPFFLFFLKLARVFIIIIIFSLRRPLASNSVIIMYKLLIVVVVRLIEDKS